MGCEWYGVIGCVMAVMERRGKVRCGRLRYVFAGVVRKVSLGLVRSG